MCIAAQRNVIQWPNAYLCSLPTQIWTTFKLQIFVVWGKQLRDGDLNWYTCMIIEQ